MTEDDRRETFERLIAAAQAGDGTLDSSPYPAHELLTYLVDSHGLLLHGSNHDDTRGARAAAGAGSRHVAARGRRVRRRNLAALLRRGRAGSRRRRRHGLHASRPRSAPAPFLPLRGLRRSSGARDVDGRRRLRAAACRLSPRVGKRVGEPRAGAAGAPPACAAGRLPASATAWSGCRLPSAFAASSAACAPPSASARRLRRLAAMELRKWPRRNDAESIGASATRSAASSATGRSPTTTRPGRGRRSRTPARR